MARFNCFPSLLVAKKKRSKESPKAEDVKKGEANGTPQVNPINETSFHVSMPKSKLWSEENLVGMETAAVELAYDGGDEHDDNLSMKRDYSDFDLQARANSHEMINLNPELGHDVLESKSERDEGITPELMIQSGHVSDPGMGRTTAFWGSPALKRSCSNIETKRAKLPVSSPTKSHSYNDLLNLSGNAGGNPLHGIQSSPLSVRTNRSADKVMLKKRSSSQVLPSRSRKLWWKLFLWSHRNLHKPQLVKPQTLLSAPNQKGGYSSDTLEPSLALEKRNKKVMENHGNQWVAFAHESSSPLDRVNAWVNSLEMSPFCPTDGDNEELDGGFVFPNSPEIGESSGKNHSHMGRHAVEEVAQANSIIQSMNTFSTVAHISGMGLKVIPSISAFSSLRSVNLSSNFIVHINPGSLPKSLHTLDLSRNKIATIEGLRELTRLRVLNLSYNRISRIGQGLANCTLIKELYLAGNKISDVEGLHRLLKLTVLDLSFNKISTAKALGQLVANYNTLLALNLVGNPIQSNIGDDQLRKAASSLLPHLTYLNKQPVRPQRVREAATDSVAKAALGTGGGWSSRRRLAKRSSQGIGSSVVAHQKGGSSRHSRPKSRHQHSTTSTRK